jgi:hypothetical protein
LGRFLQSIANNAWSGFSLFLLPSIRFNDAFDVLNGDMLSVLTACSKVIYPIHDRRKSFSGRRIAVFVCQADTLGMFDGSHVEQSFLFDGLVTLNVLSDTVSSDRPFSSSFNLPLTVQNRRERSITSG